MKMRWLFVPILLLALGAGGCAKAAQVAVTADDAAFDRIEALKLAKDAHCDAGTIPASACVSLAKAFLPVWDAYLALNRALQTGTPTGQAGPLIASFKDAGRAFGEEVNRLQEGEGRRILLDLLAAVLARF